MIRRLFLQRGKDDIYRVQSSNIINSAKLQSFTVMQTMHGDESLLGYNSNTQVLHYSDGQNQPERFKQGNSYFFVFYTGKGNILQSSRKKLRYSVIRIMYFLQIIQQYFYYNTQMNRNEGILLFDEKDILIDFIKKEDKS